MDFKAKLNIQPGVLTGSSSVFVEASPIYSRNPLKHQVMKQVLLEMHYTHPVHKSSVAGTKQAARHTSTHSSIETYGCGNKMHNFLFISRTCEGPSELRGLIDFSSFHAATLGLPIFSFIFKGNSQGSSFPISLFIPFSITTLLSPKHHHHMHTLPDSSPTAVVVPTPFPHPSPSLTLKIVIQP